MKGDNYLGNISSNEQSGVPTGKGQSLNSKEDARRQRREKRIRELKESRLFWLISTITKWADKYFLDALLGFVPSVGDLVSSAFGLPFIYVSLVKVSIQEVLSNFRPTLSFFLPQVSITIYNTLDRIILGSLSSVFDVGIYTQAVNINSILISLVATLSAVLLPRMTNLYAQGKHEEVQRVMSSSMLFNSIITFPTVFGMLLVSQEFVHLFLGRQYAESYVAINIVVFALIPIAFSEIVGRQTLIPTDNVKLFTASVMSGAVVSIVLNMLAIPLFGYRGAAVTLVVVETVVCVLMTYFARKYLDIVDLLKIATKPLVASVVTGTLVYLLFSSVLSISNNLLSMLLKVIVYSIVYGFLLLLTKTISHKELSLLRKKR